MLSYLQEGDEPGIIEETVYYIIAPIKEYGINVSNETEAMSLYSILLGQRAQAAMFAGQTKGNLLLDTGIDKIYQYYQDGFGKQFLCSMKYDLPLFVFTAMYLEDPTFRKEMKEADESLKNEVLGSIHTLCKYCYFDLVQYPDIMSLENMRIFLSYLQRLNLVIQVLFYLCFTQNTNSPVNHSFTGLL